ERPKDKPFFFWLASHDAHRPWQFNDQGVAYTPQEVKVPPMLYDGPETRKDLAGYYHEISRADHYLGRVVQELESEGLLDNTFIIFISDNGSPFPRNKARLYDSGLKVPFIVYGPDVKTGTSEALISALDIAPTVLDLAGVDIDERIQGRSFRRVLQKNAKSGVRDFVFAEHNWHVFQAHERMVRYGNWVYIRNAYPERRNLAGESTRIFPAGRELWDAHDKQLTRPEQEDVFLAPRPAEELYNVGADPYQFRNLAQEKENREILHYLSGVLDRWIRETGDSTPRRPSPDREDINGKQLPGKFKKGDKPGQFTNAVRINSPGPVAKSGLGRP
ncbi:MAG TPA: sulfatase-like hydrolase/transferase, partial [Anseongella sp.]|nr:sulfatase-like hydrolase/transferase [Anseongella sp.]